MATQDSPRMIWKHPDPESTHMGRFRRALEQHIGKGFKVGEPDGYTSGLSEEPGLKNSR